MIHCCSFEGNMHRILHARTQRCKCPTCLCSLALPGSRFQALASTATRRQGDNRMQCLRAPSQALYSACETRHRGAGRQPKAPPGLLSVPPCGGAKAAPSGCAARSGLPLHAAVWQSRAPPGGSAACEQEERPSWQQATADKHTRPGHAYSCQACGGKTPGQPPAGQSPRAGACLDSPRDPRPASGLASDGVCVCVCVFQMRAPI